jgi:hypothetical protein
MSPSSSKSHQGQYPAGGHSGGIDIVVPMSAEMERRINTELDKIVVFTNSSPPC